MFFQNGEGREKFEKLSFQVNWTLGNAAVQRCKVAGVIPYFMAGSTADMSQPQQLCSGLPRQTGEFTP